MKNENIYERTQVVAVILAVAMLFTLAFSVVVTAQEPDYTYEKTLPSDGSEDSGDVYSIERNDTSKDAYIYIEVYKSEKKANIQLENIRKVTIYFNETDVDFQKYLPMINTVGAEIEINIQSDVHLLDGEFHGVPSPDQVELNGLSWDDYTHEGDTFSFIDLEMSENTITLSYTSDLVDIIGLVFLIFFVFWFMRQFVKILRESDFYD